MKKYFKIFLYFVFFAGIITGQSNTVYTIAEKMPEFPGGTNELAKYILHNMNYPAMSREKNESGKAYVNFIIDTGGKIITPKIIKSSGYKELDGEALRLVRTMPNWIAGMDSSKKVNVSINLPIIFGGEAKADPNDVPTGLSMSKGTPEYEPKKMSPEEKEKLELQKKAGHYFNLGMDQLKQERYQFAIEKFDICLKYEPKHQNALFNKAAMHLKLGEKIKACEAWKKIIALNKNDNEVNDLIKKNCN